MMRRKHDGGISLLLAVLLLLLTGCAGSSGRPAGQGDRQRTGSMEVSYAEQFAVDYYDDGSALLTIGGTDEYLIVPEGSEPPKDTDAVVIRQPAENIYLAASSAMDLFLRLDAMDAVRMTSTTQVNWSIQAVRDALDEGRLLYAGKYSAPDFELILAEDCGLAIESAMIYHSPDIREKLEELGVPVLVERSSYESDPLGRMEWIKVYGLLLGRTEQAEEFFSGQIESLSALGDTESGGKTVAFFHINSSGAAVVRKPGDYVTNMIRMAGGEYVFDELEGQDENSLSTMNMQMEAFYAGARDADVLLYNSTIDGELFTVDQLLEKSGLLADFKAVQEGNVWCTEQNMFQETSAAAGVIADMYAILTGGAEGVDELTYFHRLK